jgi:hypothetical protein
MVLKVAIQYVKCEYYRNKKCKKVKQSHTGLTVPEGSRRLRL